MCGSVHIVEASQSTFNGPRSKVAAPGVTRINASRRLSSLASGRGECVSQGVHHTHAKALPPTHHPPRVSLYPPATIGVGGWGGGRAPCGWHEATWEPVGPGRGAATSESSESSPRHQMRSYHGGVAGSEYARDVQRRLGGGGVGRRSGDGRGEGNWLGEAGAAEDVNDEEAWEKKNQVQPE